MLQDSEDQRKNLRITQRAFYRYMLLICQIIPFFIILWQTIISTILS